MIFSLSPRRRLLLLLLSHVFVLSLLRLRLLYLLFYRLVNSEEASSITSRNRDSYSTSHSLVLSCVLFLLLTKPIVCVCVFCVHDRIFLFFASFTYANQCIHAVSVCTHTHMNVRLSSLSVRIHHRPHSPLRYLSDEWNDLLNARRLGNDAWGERGITGKTDQLTRSIYKKALPSQSK